MSPTERLEKLRRLRVSLGQQVNFLENDINTARLSGIATTPLVDALNSTESALELVEVAIRETKRGE